MTARILRIVSVLLLAACSSFAQVRGFEWGDSESDVILGEGDYWKRLVRDDGIVCLEYLDRRHVGVSAFAVYYFFEDQLIGCVILANGNNVPAWVLDVGAHYGLMERESEPGDLWYYEDENSWIEISFRDGRTAAHFGSNRGPLSKSFP